MIVVGETDSFERKYMEKFRTLASKFGEFVNYEHDRGARDIGVHLTHKLSSGKERLSTSLCWFQMKGVMASSLPADALERQKKVSIPLKVNHLRYWYLQPMPTYLVVYVECKDLFLITNIQKYVADNWGKGILKLEQKMATVYAYKESTLDEQAFWLILQKGSLQEWQKALGGEDDQARICSRDYDLIWHFGTASDRGVEHRVVFLDWQSKTRGQLYIQEKKGNSERDWETLREHWQYMMNISHLDEAYPYLEFFADMDREDGLSWDDDYEYMPVVTLSNGDDIHGEDASGEYFYYELGARLNSVGIQMFEWVKDAEQIGLIEISQEQGEMVSVAPWHHRDI